MDLHLTIAPQNDLKKAFEALSYPDFLIARLIWSNSRFRATPLQVGAPAADLVYTGERAAGGCDGLANRMRTGGRSSWAPEACIGA